MKLTSWNCNGALRKKLKAIDRLSSDIIVVPECEDPSRSTVTFQEWASNYIWDGENKNKGIGIFARPNVSIRKLDWDSTFSLGSAHSYENPKMNWSTKDLKQFIPFSINDKYTCLAVWTKGAQDQVFGYMGQFWKYLQVHKNDLNSEKTIILGDFNSNAIWDKSDRWWNHTDVVNELGEIGLYSLYHAQFREAQGKERIPTFFHQRNINKPFHIDYMFAAKRFHNSSMTIGKVEDWLEFSDHMPLSLSLED